MWGLGPAETTLADYTTMSTVYCRQIHRKIFLHGPMRAGAFRDTPEPGDPRTGTVHRNPAVFQYVGVERRTRGARGGASGVLPRGARREKQGSCGFASSRLRGASRPTRSAPPRTAARRSPFGGRGFSLTSEIPLYTVCSAWGGKPPGQTPVHREFHADGGNGRPFSRQGK